jgi:hypothetical protein
LWRRLTAKAIFKTRSQRQKRGGGAQHLSLDWQSADERYHLDPPDTASLDRVVDRERALALRERVIGRLRDESAAAGETLLFERAKGYLLVGESAIPYSQAAEELRTGSRYGDFADQAQRLGGLQYRPGVGHAVASASSISTNIGLRHTRQSGSGEACCSESARSVRVE